MLCTYGLAPFALLSFFSSALPTPLWSSFAVEFSEQLCLFGIQLCSSYGNGRFWWGFLLCHRHLASIAHRPSVTSMEPAKFVAVPRPSPIASRGRLPWPLQAPPLCQVSLVLPCLRPRPSPSPRPRSWERHRGEEEGRSHGWGLRCWLGPARALQHCTGPAGKRIWVPA